MAARNLKLELDGDPRKLAMAIFRAAQDTCVEKHGNLKNRSRILSELEKEVPELARQMVEAIDRDARDVYLINALEVLALAYAKRRLKK